MYVQIDEFTRWLGILMRFALLCLATIVLAGCARNAVNEMVDWHAPESEQSAYGQSAFDMLSTLSSGGVWVSLGQTVNLLGFPSRVMLLPLVVDKKNNVLENEIRFQLWYDSRGVVVQFSVLGAVKSVQCLAGPNHLSGWFDEQWPQRIPAPSEWPLNVGVSLDPGILDELRNELVRFTDDKLNAVDWSHAVGTTAPFVQETEGVLPFSANVCLIDGISERIARVCYHLRGNNSLYWNTWWEYSDGVWHRKGEHQEAFRGNWDHPESAD